MKKTVCFIIATLMISALSLAVLADTPLLSADKSDNANGMPYWYPLDWSDFEDFHGENLPYVVDDADILTDEEERQLSDKIASIVDRYGIGYVAFTDNDLHGLSPEYYSSDFLHFNGYGVGNGYGAVVFFLCFDSSNRCWRTTAINSYERIFTEDIMYEIDETVDYAIREEHDYFKAFMLHADYVDDLFYEIASTDNWTPSSHNYKYVRESSGGANPMTVLAAGLIVGLLGGALRVASLRKKMKIVPPRTANNYLIDSSYVVRDRQCHYLYTTVTRREKPRESSSGGSNGSSYSSGHSSGGSFSSGGRSF